MAENKPRRDYRPKGPRGNETSTRDCHPPAVDLRERLNKMRQGRLEHAETAEGEKNPPPPDPAYNFLKDPMRGDEIKTPNEKSPRHRGPPPNKNDRPRNHFNQNYQEKIRQSDGNPRDRIENRDYTSAAGKAPWKSRRSNERRSEKPPPQRPMQIKDCDNIKVEFSSETGSRTCSFESTKVGVPCSVDKAPRRQHSFNKRNYNGKPFRANRRRNESRGSPSEGGEDKRQEQGGTNHEEERDKLNNVEHPNKHEDEHNDEQSNEKLEENSESNLSAADTEKRPEMVENNTSENEDIRAEQTQRTISETNGV